MGEELKRIPVGSSSESAQIESHKRYRVKIDGQWFEGYFSKKSFGWNFDDYRNFGVHLSQIDAVYELPDPVTKPKPKRKRRPKLKRDRRPKT